MMPNTTKWTTRNALVNRQRDGKHCGQVGSSLEKDTTLMQCLTDKLVLLVIELHNGLLQIAYASMNKFC